MGEGTGRRKGSKRDMNEIWKTKGKGGNWVGLTSRKRAQPG